MLKYFKVYRLGKEVLREKQGELPKKTAINFMKYSSY